MLFDQGLNSSEMFLLAFEREGLVKHLIGLNLQDLLSVDTDMALIVNRLLVTVLC